MSTSRTRHAPTLQERIAASRARLTGADRGLIAAILQDPAEAALGSSATLAARGGAHPASLTRLARRLGFGDFAALREALRDEFIRGAEDSPALLQRRLAGARTGILATVVARETEALAELGRHVEDATLHAAAGLLLQAERVVVCGEGSAEAAAQLFARRLRRLGIAAGATPSDPRSLAEAMGPLRRGDAAVWFAFRAQPPFHAAMARAAQERGLRSLVIADHAGARLSPTPEMLIAAPRGRPGEQQSLIAPLALIAALLLATAERGGPPRIAALRGYWDLRRSFEAGRAAPSRDREP